MYDYQRKGYSQYGAHMGRQSTLSDDTKESCIIRRVEFHDGDYDAGGAYWGGGTPLFYIESQDSGEVAYVRASSMQAARAEFPHAKWIDGPIAGHADADLSDFFDAYVTAALFSSTDESDDSGGEPLDANYGPDDIAPETLDKMRRNCVKFMSENAADIGVRASDAGRDFWMTRNRHGVGFWETPDWPADAGQRLTDAAQAFGEVNLYVGDDGKIYQDRG